MSVFVDTSVWVDHLRAGNAELATLLEGGAVAVEHDEVLRMVEQRTLSGRGVGWVDMHLLAAAMLAGVRLWTDDGRLANVARELRLAEAP